jgi:uncharacterized protein (UPF0212 family)
MDCRVVVEAAISVYDVETEDEAIRIAISKAGEMLNPDLNYVEISMGTRTSPSGEELSPAFIAADEALVALELEMTVFNVEQEEHASRIARKEIGQRLENVPLKILRVLPLDEDGNVVEEASSTDGRPAGTGGPDGTSGDEGRGNDGGDGNEDGEGDEDEEDDLIPEFEELVDE